MSTLLRFIDELRRRKVFTAAVAYIAFGLGAMEGAGVIVPAMGLPAWVLQGVVVAVLLGFPVILVAAWLYEWSGGGIQRTPESPTGAVEGRRGDDSAPTAPGSRARRLALAWAGVLLLTMAVAGFWWTRRAPAVTAAGWEIRTLAVLPFQNPSGDPELDNLAFGLAERITNDLSAAPDLAVIAQSSVARVAQTGLTLPEIAERLGVRGILSGRLVERQGVLSVSAALVDVESGERQVWGDDFDRPRRDLITIERDLSKEVARALRLRLSPSARAALYEGGTENRLAYELYLAGNRMLITQAYDPEALELFQQAIRQDPDYAAAYAGLAQAYNYRILFGDLPFDVAVSGSRAAIDRAMALDSTIADTYVALGTLRLFADVDFEGAKAALERALGLSPGSAAAHYTLGAVLLHAGEFDAALEELRVTRRLDPLARNAVYMTANAHLARRDHAAAAAHAQRVLELAPEHPGGRQVLFEALWYGGDRGRALELYPGPEDTREVMALIASGDRKGARLRLDRWADLPPDDRPVSGHWLALMYAWLGARDEALDWLERGFAEPRGAFAFSQHWMNPGWDAVRDSPRFAALLDSIGLPHVR